MPDRHLFIITVHFQLPKPDIVTQPSIQWATLMKIKLHKVNVYYTFIHVLYSFNQAYANVYLENSTCWIFLSRVPVAISPRAEHSEAGSARCTSRFAFDIVYLIHVYLLSLLSCLHSCYIIGSLPHVSLLITAVLCYTPDYVRYLNPLCVVVQTRSIECFSSCHAFVLCSRFRFSDPAFSFSFCLLSVCWSPDPCLSLFMLFALPLPILN